MSKREEIDPEFRIWLIEECLAGRMRGREAARRAGVSSSAMRKWISLYKMDGPAAFASSNAKRTYSGEIKKKVVKDYLNGKGSFQTLCEKYHLHSPELVNQWVKSYNGRKDSKKNSGGFFMTKRKSNIPSFYAKESRLCKPCVEKPLIRANVQTVCRNCAAAFLHKERTSDLTI